MNANVRESELQRWFVEKAQANEICDAIENLAALENLAGDRQGAVRHADRPGRLGLERARHICSMLAEDRYLFQNLSVAPAGSKQMRPDLVTVTSGGSYMLVELKTQRGPERQGVQELLAYSTAIKMQAPYANDFLYVVVARHWDALLSFSVRALILDGKNVLPLRWNRLAAGQFSLSVMLELFDFRLEQPYDPWDAMVPYTLAVSLGSHARASMEVHTYYYQISRRLIDECQRLLQTGFVLNWSNESVRSLTLVTVNQNWVFSEHTWRDPSPYTPSQPQAFDLVLEKVAAAARDAARRSEPFWDEDDPWGACAGSDATREFYPESSLSCDLMERYRSRPHEDWLSQIRATTQLFESGQVQNLGIFLNYVLKEQAAFGLEIKSFWPFGELADVVGPRTRVDSLWKLCEVLRSFRRAKKPGPPGRFD